MKMIKKAKWTYIGISVLSLILGICLLLWPQLSAVTLCVIIGAVTLVVGIVRLICYFSRDSSGARIYSGMALGLIDAVIGVLLLIHPFDAIKMLPLVLGILIIVDAMFKLEAAVELKRAGVASWYFVLALALACVLFGILLVFNPFGGAVLLMVMMGIALVIEAIQGICAVIYVQRCLNE